MKKPISFISTFFFLAASSYGAVLSEHSFEPYADITINAHWDAKYQDMEPMGLVEVSQKSGVKHYRLAFLTDAGSCVPAWGGQQSYAVKDKWGAHLTDNMRANKIRNSISFGGASGNDLSQACSAEALNAVYEQVLTAYQPAGLDFDIENGTANVNKIMLSLQTFQTQHPTVGISFTLPVLPEGLTAEGMNIIKAAQTHKLNFTVNIMAMDYGPAYTGSMGQYAIQAATSLHDFLQTLYPASSEAAIWKMIEVTPMVGVNDVNIESFTLQDVDILRQFASQNHLAALSMWSIARDNPCADKWASPICSGNNLQTAPYDFSKRFLQG